MNKVNQADSFQLDITENRLKTQEQEITISKHEIQKGYS
jgi:hypothetical protein